MFELNEYFTKTGKTFVVINGGSDWEGYKPHKVTIKDLIRYYYKDARNDCWRLEADRQPGF